MFIQKMEVSGRQTATAMLTSFFGDCVPVKLFRKFIIEFSGFGEYFSLRLPDTPSLAAEYLPDCSTRNAQRRGGFPEVSLFMLCYNQSARCAARKNRVNRSGKRAICSTGQKRQRPWTNMGKEGEKASFLVSVPEIYYSIAQ